MYLFIRWVLSILLTVLFVVILVRHKSKRKKRMGIKIAGIICVLLLSEVLLSFIPIENAFIGFETPEKAFAYQYAKEKPDNFYKGSQVCWATYDDRALASFYKTSRGWKMAPIPLCSSAKLLYDTSSYSVILEKIYGKEEKKITVLQYFDATKHDIEISDSKDSRFLEVNSVDINRREHYAIVSLKKGEEYKLNINGSEVVTYTT